MSRVCILFFISIAAKTCQTVNPKKAFYSFSIRHFPRQVESFILQLVEVVLLMGNIFHIASLRVKLLEIKTGKRA